MNFLHYYWTGKEPPAYLIKNLNNWALYLKKHDSLFKIILWIDLLNKDITHKLNPNISIKEFSTIKFEKIYINLHDVYIIFKRNKLFAFASDLARILILNAYPGIYIDIDIKPNFDEPFPKNKESFLQLFDSKSSIKFYAPPMHYEENFFIENWILFYFGFPQGLRFLLAEMEQKAKQDKLLILHCALQHKEFCEHEQCKHMQKSNFKVGYKRQLQAYLKRDATSYKRATQETFFEYKAKIPSFSNKYFNTGYFKEGTPVWTNYLQMAYKSTDLTFKDKLNTSAMSYHLFYQKEIAKFFQQDQESLPLFSWCDPGFQRLNELNAAATLIQKAYRAFLLKNNVPSC